MFPNSYTFNPGVVLDPLTMTPMITNSGNITVNPLGVPSKAFINQVRPEQKVWQKMFINNIPQECTNEIMLRLLNEFGAVKNFKRAVDNRGRLLKFCHFELQTGEQILRIKRLFNNIKILDKVLQIKISAQTDNFIKQWMTIQKDQWRKKLLAPSLNEAKQFDSIEAYQMRDDRAYKQRIQDCLRQVNIEVKKLAVEKSREQERKQHRREKERDRARKKMQDDLIRSYDQKEDYWLKREREKEREFRKEKEKQKEREKQKIKRLEKQLALEPEELQKRIAKYLTPERRKQIEKQEQQDIQNLMEANPPLPEEATDEQNRKIRAIAEEEIKIGNEKIEELLADAPQKIITEEKVKEFKRNEMFDGWNEEQHEEQKPKFDLNLPEIHQNLIDKEEEARIQSRLAQIQKMVPQNKEDLWQFPINWEKLSKSVVLQRNIRPWLQEQSNYYMGGIEEKFIALVEKKLLSRSHPDKLIKILYQLLDQDTEEFVIRLWKTLVFEFLKLENGLV